jgi:hypothetical protein
MTKLPGKMCILFASFTSALILQTARAEQTLITMQDPHRLAIQLPEVDRTALIESVRSLRSQLPAGAHWPIGSSKPNNAPS